MRSVFAMSFDIDTMGKLARALESIGSASDPVVVALRAAVASEAPEDIAHAQELIMSLDPAHRNAALKIVMGG